MKKTVYMKCDDCIYKKWEHPYGGGGEWYCDKEEEPYYNEDEECLECDGYEMAGSVRNMRNRRVMNHENNCESLPCIRR